MFCISLSFFPCHFGWFSSLGQPWVVLQCDLCSRVCCIFWFSLVFAFGFPILWGAEKSMILSEFFFLLSTCWFFCFVVSCSLSFFKIKCLPCILSCVSNLIRMISSFALISFVCNFLLGTIVPVSEIMKLAANNSTGVTFSNVQSFSISHLFSDDILVIRLVFVLPEQTRQACYEHFLSWYNLLGKPYLKRENVIPALFWPNCVVFNSCETAGSNAHEKYLETLASSFLYFCSFLFFGMQRFPVCFIYSAGLWLKPFYTSIWLCLFNPMGSIKGMLSVFCHFCHDFFSI